MPTMIDLFCGAGGMTAGFRAAGFTPVLAADIDPVATATYAANHGEHVVTGSVADLREVPKADLVIGGPPCQGFSALGLRDPDDLPDPAGLRPAVGAALTKFAALHPNLVAHRNGPRQVAVSAGRVRALFGYQGDLVPGQSRDGYPRGTLVRDREGDIWRKGTTWWLWTGRETGTGAGKLRWSDLVRRYGPIELVRMP